MRPADALAFGIILELMSLAILMRWVNHPATLLSFGGSACDFGIDTLRRERRTPQNIVIGGGAAATQRQMIAYTAWPRWSTRPTSGPRRRPTGAAACTPARRGQAYRWALEILKRPTDQRRFELRPRRWIVERSFAPSGLPREARGGSRRVRWLCARP
jgi:hypothetical protein